MHKTKPVEKHLESKLLRITGRVQGVGFRPFIFRLANKYNLHGQVKNSGSDVTIHIQGKHDDIKEFTQHLIKDSPRISQPYIAHSQICEIVNSINFEIVQSEDTQHTDVHIPPDYYVCEKCLEELEDKEDRRHHYPFINCTQCGPRYTLIKTLPYDRTNTTMRNFQLCDKCSTEYNDPHNRRYHAEPVSCPDCGPQLEFKSENYSTADNAEALRACVNAIKNGEIVILKGIGGYHIICDAHNKQAIQQLRQCKHRPDKPLAVMFPLSGDDGLDLLRKHVHMTNLEAKRLSSPERPIILLQKKTDSSLPYAIAPGFSELGVMLPYSPLHYIILNMLNAPVIATSANLSGEPVLTDNKDVEDRLRHISTQYLHHNRPIQRPADDPIYRSISKKLRPFRLGRGNTPLELTLPFTLNHPVLASGGQMKNTIALA